MLFDRVSFDIECPKVIVDNYEGAFQAVNHLIKTGCKRIAHLGGPMNCKVFEDRARGYHDAISNAGLEVLPQHVFSTDLSERDVLVAKNAANGDAHFQELFASYGRHLANAIKTIIFTLDPAAIILGGAVS